MNSHFFDSQDQYCSCIGFVADFPCNIQVDLFDIQENILPMSSDFQENSLGFFEDLFHNVQDFVFQEYIL